MDQLFRPDRFFSPDGNGLEIDNERRETDGGGQIGEPWDGEIMISKGGQNRVGFDAYARETCLFPFFSPHPFDARQPRAYSPARGKKNPT